MRRTLFGIMSSWPFTFKKTPRLTDKGGIWSKIFRLEKDISKRNIESNSLIEGTVEDMECKILDCQMGWRLHFERVFLSFI
ncbi:hypothetical protein Hdeb2414_s0001g00010911 [Helianthus debilis subsp. tardiflorus]